MEMLDIGFTVNDNPDIASPFLFAGRKGITDTESFFEEGNNEDPCPDLERTLNIRF